MYIGKPFRLLIPTTISSAVAGGTFVITKSPWRTIVTFFVAFAIFTGIISRLDKWLRRKTKDRLWLRSYEGQQWLATDEGRQWKRRT